MVDEREDFQRLGGRPDDARNSRATGPVAGVNRELLQPGPERSQCECFTGDEVEVNPYFFYGVINGRSKRLARRSQCFFASFWHVGRGDQ